MKISAYVLYMILLVSGAVFGFAMVYGLERYDSFSHAERVLSKLAVVGVSFSFSSFMYIISITLLKIYKEIKNKE